MKADIDFRQWQLDILPQIINRGRRKEMSDKPSHNGCTSIIGLQVFPLRARNLLPTAPMAHHQVEWLENVPGQNKGK